MLDVVSFQQKSHLLTPCASPSSMGHSVLICDQIASTSLLSPILHLCILICTCEVSEGTYFSEIYMRQMEKHMQMTVLLIHL